MNAIKKLFVKMVMNHEQEISFMKLGGNLVALASVVLTMPSMGFHVGIDILNVAKLVIALAGAMGIAGARDAIGKGK